MKTLLTLAAIATFSAINVLAQTGPEYLTITVSGNSNPQPVSMTMEFSVNGDDAFNGNDTTSIDTAIVTTNAPDSLIIPSTNVITPFSYSQNGNGVRISNYDARPCIDRFTYYSFGIGSFVDDTITVSANSFFGIDPSNASNNAEITYVYIQNLTTGTIYQLLNNNVTFVIPANPFFEMNYKLIILTRPAITTVPVTCFNDSNGSIQIHNPICVKCFSWNFSIYKNENLIRTSEVPTTDTTLSDFLSGYYAITIYVDGFLADSELVYVGSPAQVIPSFSADNYSPFTNDFVLFTNQSSGANAFNWTFGDNSTDSVANPTHSFSIAGNYPVTLTASNSNGCNASFTDTIRVSTQLLTQGPHVTRGNAFSPNSTERISNSLDVNVSSGSQSITVSQKGESQEMDVQLININGQLISSTSTMNQIIRFEFLQAGIYVVTISSKSGEVVSEKVIVNN